MTQEYFPGSRQVVTPPAGLPDPLSGTEGKSFTIAGRAVELFSISQVARVLHRSPVTIRKWERDDVIPKATYVKPGAGGDARGRRRLYSREQVLALVQIARDEKILYDLHASISKTRFSEKVFSAFRSLSIAAKESK